MFQVLDDLPSRSHDVEVDGFGDLEVAGVHVVAEDVDQVVAEVAVDAEESREIGESFSLGIGLDKLIILIENINKKRETNLLAKRDQIVFDRQNLLER